MIFNSIQFLFFFVIVTTSYFLLPHKFRWFMLLAASCYFYMAFVPVYILILGFTIVIDYFAGIWIENAEGARRKTFLVGSLVANIGVLAVFKYYNFINTNITYLLNHASVSNPFPYLSILLPIGLSFHTFQAMSYTIEVYRGHQKAERHFGIYALYVMYYPQLVAGPIERPQNMLRQFHEKKEFRYDDVTSGLRLMAWGLFKKIVIADRLAVVANQVFNNPESYNSFSLIIGVVFFSFQIFCDFSGYSDIAIGASRIMGIRLMKNFDMPYQSKSISEFWRRWHISLSTWFKDYLYISLGGNRVSIPRWYFNLFFVFMISGLWHGANWTFIIWGTLHGIYLVFALISERFRKVVSDKIPLLRSGIINVFATFILVAFAWIFFRANSVNSALYIIKHIFTGIPDLFRNIAAHESIFQNLGLTRLQLLISLLLIIGLELVHRFQKKYSINQWIIRRPAAFRWSVYYMIILLIVFGSAYGSKQFIYFQF